MNFYICLVTETIIVTRTHQESVFLFLKTIDFLEIASKQLKTISKALAKTQKFRYHRICSLQSLCPQQFLNFFFPDEDFHFTYCAFLLLFLLSYFCMSGESHHQRYHMKDGHRSVSLKIEGK